MNHMNILGIKIVVSPDVKPKLSDEIMPGLPWPVGFKEDMDAWMAAFFSGYNIVGDGECLKLRDTLIMNPRTFRSMETCLKNEQLSAQKLSSFGV